MRSKRGRVFTRWSTLAVLAVLLTITGAGSWLYLEKYVGRRAKGGTLESAPVLEKRVYSFWTADLGKVVLPETPVSGKVRGNVVEGCAATLEGGTLSLRRPDQDCSLEIVLFAQHPQELSGKAFEIPLARPNPRPRIELSWRNEKAQSQTETFDAGYVLKMSFGQPAQGKIPGEIYLSLPDNYRSFVAGRFVAEVIDPGKK